MELRDVLTVLWRRRWLVILAVLLAGGSSTWLSVRSAPTYVAESSVFIGPRTMQRADFSGALQELLFTKELVASYAEMFERLPLLERVVEEADAPYTAAQLKSKISTRILPETRIIEVSVRDANPRRAQRLANGVVQAFLGDLKSSFGAPATVIEPAALPAAPVSPRPLRDGVLGSFLGLMLGALGGLTLDRADTTIRNREDAEQWLAPMPVLGVIPVMQNSREDDAPVVGRNGQSPASEAFRMLRTTLQFLSVDRPIKRLVVTSPYAREGKTTVAANLASAFALAGFRTVLLEADLRRPMVHELFGMPASPGLCDALIDVAGIEGVVRPTGMANLSVVTCGTLPGNPAEVLGSRRMAAVLGAISTRCDVLVIDTPPALPLADANALASSVDGALLVLRAGKSRRGHASQAIESLARIGFRVVGVALNATRESRWGYYRNYYRYEGLRALGHGKSESPPLEPSQVFPVEPLSGPGAVAQRPRLPAVPPVAPGNGHAPPWPPAGFSAGNPPGGATPQSEDLG